MNKQLSNLYVWFVSAPQHAKKLVWMAVIILIVAAMLVPAAVAWAGPMGGDPDGIIPTIVVLGGGL